MLKKHYYCPNCNIFETNADCNVNSDESIETENIVNEISCDCEEKANYFIEVALDRQLESLYKRPGFYNKLLKRKDLNEDIDCYRDIYDAQIYKELCNNNVLSDDKNISFMWYSDGVSIFNSSKFNIWGFFLVINDLPYNERYKLENVLLVSLWFGDKKPVPNIFLEPIKNSFRKLYKGMEFYVQDLEKKSLCGGLLQVVRAIFRQKLCF